MSATCTECDQTIEEQTRFCGGCGAEQPLTAAQQAALERYREVMARFRADGVDDERERRQLERLRRRLGISPADHRRLVEEVHAVVPQRQAARREAVELGLAVDLATLEHFAAGNRCLIRLRLENRGELALEHVLIHPRFAGGDAPEPAELADLFPGQSDVANVWTTPEVAGFHELSGVVETVDLAGGERRYRFDEVQYRVGAAGSVPQVQVVNIDQRSARVVDNSRSSFAGGNPKGGLVGDGDWRLVDLDAVDAARAATLLGREPPEPTRLARPRRGGPFIVRSGEHTYRVLRPVAEGDVATVYAGEREDGDGEVRRVAVKVARDPADNDLMGREARALRHFAEDPGPQRKHLPELLDQFRTADGQLGSVLGWLDAHDLHSVREKYPDGVPEEPATWIFRRTLSAIGFAHSRGVIHGNIEPAHIMVRAEDHNVFLVDWCYAAIKPAQSGDGFVLLNEVYSPPEVAERRPPIPPSDLYSLGKTMIFLLGGDPEAETLPERVDERVQRLVRYFIRKSPLQRPQDAWEMYDQLDVLRRELFGPHTFREFVL